MRYEEHAKQNLRNRVHQGPLSVSGVKSCHLVVLP